MVLLTAYNGEILERIFNLALFALVILAAKNLKGAMFYLLACAVLLAALFYPINAWGNEQVDYIPPSEIAASEFFYEHAPPSYGIAASPARIWGYGSLEALNTVGYSWQFTIAGEAIETHWSFLGQLHEMASLLQEDTESAGRVYDGASVQVFAQPGEVEP
jgi:hypothetical protein